MKYNICPKCKSKISADLAECPECGYVFSVNKNRTPILVGSCLLIAAFAGGLAFNIKAVAPEPTPSTTPEIIEIVAPTPTPSPTVTSIRLYAFGRELDADGFTAYVGDKAFTLSIILEPEIRNPEVSWSILDSHGTSESAALSVSSDGMSCEFSALKPTGKNELTVRCFGAEIMIPVYLWER